MLTSWLEDATMIILHGAFNRLLRDDEKAFRRVYYALIRFTIYAERKRDQYKKRAFTLADAAEELEGDDQS